MYEWKTDIFLKNFKMLKGVLLLFTSCMHQVGDRLIIQRNSSGRTFASSINKGVAWAWLWTKSIIRSALFWIIIYYKIKFLSRLAFDDWPQEARPEVELQLNDQMISWIRVKRCPDQRWRNKCLEIVYQITFSEQHTCS